MALSQGFSRRRSPTPLKLKRVGVGPEEGGEAGGQEQGPRGARSSTTSTGARARAGETLTRGAGGGSAGAVLCSTHACAAVNH